MSKLMDAVKSVGREMPRGPVTLTDGVTGTVRTYDTAMAAEAAIPVGASVEFYRGGFVFSYGSGSSKPEPAPKAPKKSERADRAKSSE